MHEKSSSGTVEECFVHQLAVYYSVWLIEVFVDYKPHFVESIFLENVYGLCFRELKIRIEILMGPYINLHRLQNINENTA